MQKVFTAIFMMTALVVFLSACGGGGNTPVATQVGGPKPPPDGISVLNLRIIPDTTNATLIWDNPDADIANISISYKNSTAVNFEAPIIIDDDRIAANATDVKGIILVDSLISNETYTFSVALELKGVDENATTSAMQITRLIGPNLDQDEYADDDPLELDEDGDGVDDERDVFPRNATLYGFAVTELSATPGAGEVTLSWNNPDAEIASINISYHNTNTPNALQYFPLITDSTKIGNNTENIQQVIDGLTNGVSYNFTVALTLIGDDANKKVMAAFITATPGIFSVTDLTATPGDSSVTLSWNNPDANISSINISYYNINTPGTLEGDILITDDTYTGMNTNVEQMITSSLTPNESYNFTVALILGGDDAGREGPAPFITVGIGLNDDGDSIANFLDVDDNGNGLIEIHNAEELNQVRADLNGASFAGDSAGCGGQNGITTCNGYELSADISLDGYANWEPIGSCSTGSTRVCNNINGFFNTTFDGNGWTINNLTIINSEAKPTGLFGGITSTAVLRNVHIRSGNISGGNNVGLLVGYARGASISNSSAAGEVTASGFYVGGLVGYGESATITSSYVMDITIVSGGERVGGLVGNGESATITSSYVVDITILSTRNFVGGLVGFGLGVTITSSYAAGGSVIGGIFVGGLAGQASGSAVVTLSYVEDSHVNATSNVGGLVGYGDELEITSSYVGADVVINSTGNNIGGLIGTANNNVVITSSYAAAEYVKEGDNVGGLVGHATATTINDSYWDNQTSGSYVTLTIGNRDSDDTNAGRRTEDLKMPDTFTGSIYADWEGEMCDNGSRAWDLGTASQYPALTCTPNGLPAQRP